MPQAFVSTAIEAFSSFRYGGAALVWLGAMLVAQVVYQRFAGEPVPATSRRSPPRRS